MSESAAGRISHRDKDGNLLELLEWGRLYEDYDYRRIAETNLEGDVLVRTMWEGLDAGIHGGGCMFHTGLRQNGQWQCVWEGQYPCTVAEAEAAHESVVASVRESPTSPNQE
ncbi:hypothetical protein ACF06W_11350 [Streptomyces albus]|uniref:hypothetical protein n=1 Tax=Streptomyces albus TaxID=1888 RepID=UPI0036FD0895